MSRKMSSVFIFMGKVFMVFVASTLVSAILVVRESMKFKRENPNWDEPDLWTIPDDYDKFIDDKGTDNILVAGCNDFNCLVCYPD